MPMMSVGRRVALVCLDLVDTQSDLQLFNYAIRRVHAQLLNSGLEGLEVHFVEQSSRDIDELVGKIEEIEPDVIGASVYVWSFEPLVKALSEVKRRRPETTVVLGGPSARPSMFDRAPFDAFRRDVDALVLGEGEYTFAEIVGLSDRSKASLSRIAGLALPTELGWRRTAAAGSITNLDALASPYVNGLFPSAVRVQIETFRGCPLACKFCQWGDADNNSRIFSKEYLIRDIEHIRALGAKKAMLVDAALNLNSRAFRNFASAAEETDVFREMSLMFEVYPSHLTDQHLRFIEKLGSRADVGVGLQSYDKEVLRRLQRAFDERRFEAVVSSLAGLGCSVSIEIIMGLPGDNPDSFMRTIERARRLPCDIRIFHCLALPGALMDNAPPWADIDFDPVTLKVRSCAGWSAADIERVAKMLTEMDQHAATDISWTLVHERSMAKNNRPIVLSKEEHEKLAGIVRQATGGEWKVARAERYRKQVLLTVEADAYEFVVELARNEDGHSAFHVEGDLAVSYRSGAQVPVPASALETLKELAQRGANGLREFVCDGA